MISYDHSLSKVFGGVAFVHASAELDSFVGGISVASDHKLAWKCPDRWKEKDENEL